MNTNPSIIIVTSKTKHEGSGGGRPSWMHDGSFIVFRKLEQDVEGFETLTDRYSEYDCKNKAQMGAKLMGRWANGDFTSSYSKNEGLRDNRGSYCQVSERPRQ